MSHEFSGKSEAQLADLTAFIEAEAEQARKSIKVQAIVLAVVSLVLIIYFAVFNKFVKQWTEPKDLAVYAVRFVDDNSPNFAKVIEEMLRTAAPQVADFVAQRAVKDGVPFLVKTTEGYLKRYADRIAKDTALEMERGFDQALIANKADIIRLLQENQDSSDPNFAMGVLRERLQRSFVEQTTRPNTEARKAIKTSLRMLRNMATRIRTLAAKDPKQMDKNERMADRLLRYQWMWMRQPTHDGDDHDKSDSDD